MHERNDDDISKIERWLETQKYLPQDLSRNFINTFLLGCDGSVDKAKKVISNYFYARQSTPEIFTRRDPLLKENLQAWKTSCFVPLKGLQNGSRVFLGTSLNSENYDLVAFVKQMFMCYDLLINNEEWGNGDRIVILCYDKIKFSHLGMYNVYITRKTAECERENFLPGKLKAVHNVHVPPFMRKIHERFKPYLTAEDEKAILFHPNLRSLYRHVSPEILPLELGGRAGCLKDIASGWLEILKAHRTFFIEEEQKRLMEAKGKTKYRKAG